MVQSESIQSTSGLQLPFCTLSACEFIEKLQVDTVQRVLRLASEKWSPLAIVWRCLCDPMFSRFVRDGRMDGRTDTRRQHVPR